jgi:hypothetical protein
MVSLTVLPMQYPTRSDIKSKKNCHKRQSPPGQHMNPGLLNRKTTCAATCETEHRCGPHKDSSLLGC